MKTIYSAQMQRAYWKKNMKLARKVYSGQKGWPVLLIQEHMTFRATCGGSSFKDIGYENHMTLFVKKYQEVVDLCGRPIVILPLDIDGGAEIYKDVKDFANPESLLKISKELDTMRLKNDIYNPRYKELFFVAKESIGLIVSNVGLNIGIDMARYWFYDNHAHEYGTFMLDFAIQHLKGNKPKTNDYLFFMDPYYFGDNTFIT